MRGMPSATHTSRGVRQAKGKSLRETVPRTGLATWKPRADRPDPISLLEQSNSTRLSDLVPIRNGRMLVSPFTYLRGSPIVMMSDFATTATTGIEVQACGDAHLLNFGLYGAPDRALVFDVNDFDETLPGPWEWDLKRLTVSLVVAARDNGLTEEHGKEAARSAAAAYRTHMRTYAGMGNLDVYYERVDADQVLAVQSAAGRKIAQKGIDRAKRHTGVDALPKLTAMVDGHRQIIDNPPLVTHNYPDDGDAAIHRMIAGFHDYVKTLPDERRPLLERYTFVDFARKVVGVGSVGTRCFVMLLLGADGKDALFLQIKEAQTSVLEPHVAHKSRYKNQGQRVVVGQHMMQAASDIFLGWTSDPDEGRYYYVRQLRDMKGSANVEGMDGAALARYGDLCGWTLARAHARTGDPSELTGYIGTGAALDDAIVAFSTAYADQNEKDYEALQAAVKSGRVKAETGV